MTYYFVSFDPSKFQEFPERFPALSDGKWIKSDGDMKSALQGAGKQGIFFFDLSKTSKELDSWVMIVRDSAPDAKIIFVTTDQKPQDLKTHQLSPVGGDAYVSRNVSEETLERILLGFNNQITNLRGNKLEKTGANKVAQQFDLNSLMAVKNDSLSRELDELFKEAAPATTQKPKFQSIANFGKGDGDEESGDDMSDKDQELSLDELEELDISETPDLPETPADDDGLDLALDSDVSLDLGSADDLGSEEPAENLGDLDLGGGEDLSLGDLNLAQVQKDDDQLSLSDDEPSGLVLSDEGTNGLDFGSLDGDISPDAKEKLAEIDAIMEEDSKVDLAVPADMNLLEEAAEIMGGPESAEPDFALADADADSLDLGGIDDSLAAEAKPVADENEMSINFADEGFAIADIPAAGTDDKLDSDLDQPLVSDDIDLGNLDFGSEPAAQEDEEDKTIAAMAPRVEKTSTRIKRKKEKEPKEERDEGETRVVRLEKPMGQELKEISGAYSAELERMQATLSNLRSDREELLTKIQTLEEEKLLHNRQTLSLRAELDEKKIELSIVRKKLNEDISELKDRLRLEEERRLILEEKNRVLREEVDKSAQKNKIDVKKVQLRERELEQRLELLKADAETQIRNRDLKILELKRKIDGMEFDMESMQTQEKRTVESRFELEDKLEKAIKTLRSAISVLEDETDKSAAIDALKKNIEM